MFCPNCGVQNADNAVNCVSCGTVLVAQQQPQQPTYQQPIYQQPIQPPTQSVPGKGLGIASMVVGIVSLVLFCTVWIAFFCALVGVVLGAIGISKAKQVGAKNGMAVAGVTCSIISLGIVLILFIIVGASITPYMFM